MYRSSETKVEKYFESISEKEWAYLTELPATYLSSYLCQEFRDTCFEFFESGKHSPTQYLYIQKSTVNTDGCEIWSHHCAYGFDSVDRAVQFEFLNP